MNRRGFLGFLLALPAMALGRKKAPKVMPGECAHAPGEALCLNCRVSWVNLGVEKYEPPPDVFHGDAETPYIWPEEQAPGTPPYSVPEFVRYDPPLLFDGQGGVGPYRAHLVWRDKADIMAEAPTFKGVPLSYSKGLEHYGGALSGLIAIQRPSHEY